MYYTIKTWHTDSVQSIVDEIWSGREVDSNYKDDSSTAHLHNRFIQVQAAFPHLKTIHYEYICNHWELHVESPEEKDDYNYALIAHHLRNAVNDNEIELVEDDRWLKAKYRKETDINDRDSLKQGLVYLSDRFDPHLEYCSRHYKSIDLAQEYMLSSALKPLDESSEVSLQDMKLTDLFNINLTIPDYQRIYCWQDTNIQTLWDNLTEMPVKQEYHLGAIILQCRNDERTGKYCYDIIDGQQRLVTLTLILRALGYEGNMPLLLQRFESKEACDNISNAKYVIQEIRNREHNDSEQMLSKIIDNLTFSVLLLNTNNLDLAYTFFTNQNQHSRGVRLSDYDILKAHHLRFLISNDKQAEHLARRWNMLSQEEDSSSGEREAAAPYGSLNIHKALGLHLFRIRKWIRRQSSDMTECDRPVKEEYSAAPLIPGIPPFCERFYFNEKIQGGAHFFAFVEHFVEIYKRFIKTPQVTILRKHLKGESHWKYESVMETILFAYFTKFGSQYLSEALFCIAGAVAQHRYQNDRALNYKIHEHMQNSELVMMIDQASCPSYFLAEALHLIKVTGKSLERSDIKLRFYFALRNAFKEISAGHDEKDARFTDTFIESKMKSEYE